MNDEKGGLIFVGSTLTAGLLIAAAWTASISTSASFFETAVVITGWTVVNLL